MLTCLSKIATLNLFVLLIAVPSVIGAQNNADSADDKKRDAEFARFKSDLEGIKIENARLAAELEKTRQSDKQKSQERIFVDVRSGGSLGLSNIAGSGFGYATGIEMLLGSGFSAHFRFANGLLSISTSDFNNRLQGETVQVTGTGNLSSTYFAFSSGLAYYLLQSEGFSLGLGASVMAKKLAGSLFEAPVYPAAAAELFAWYRVFPGIDLGLSGRFEYAKIAQISVSGSNVLFGESKSANEAGLMLALRFAVM